MISMRIMRTQVLRMFADLEAKPLNAVQFTAQVQPTMYGELEDADVIPGDAVQNEDGTFNYPEGYEDVVG